MRRLDTASSQLLWLVIGVLFWVFCIVYVRREPSDRSRLWYLWFATAFLMVVGAPLLANVLFHNLRFTLIVQGLSILASILLGLVWVILGILSLFQKG